MASNNSLLMETVKMNGNKLTGTKSLLIFRSKGFFNDLPLISHEIPSKQHITNIEEQDKPAD